MALNKTLSLQQLQLMQIEKMKKKLTSDVVSPSNGIDHDLGIVTQIDLKETTTDLVDKEHLQKLVEKQQLELSQLTKQKEKEIEKLKQTLENERSILSEQGFSSTATQKIIDLSHKNRDLHVEIAKERTKVKHLQEKVKQLQQTMNNYEEDLHHQSCEVDPSVEKRLKDTIYQLEAKLLQTKQKVIQQTNLAQSLKQDLKIAHKILTREIGEGFSINTLLTNGGSGWRGRSQQIIALQDKLKEFQSTNKEDKQKFTVHKIEIANKQKVQELKDMLEQLQHEYDELKVQCNALKARNKTLTSEVKEYKNRVSMLNKQLKEKEIKKEDKPCQQNEHTSKDNEMIKSLYSQLSYSNGERERLERRVLEMQTLLKGRETTTTAESTQLKLPPIRNKGILRNSVSAGNEQEEQKYSSEDFDKVVKLCRIKEMERDKLMELNVTLQQRLDTAYSDMLQMKQHILKHSRVNQDRQSKTKCEDITDFHERISLQEDENKVLRQKLELCQKQKLEDMKLLQTLLRDVKTVSQQLIN